MHVQQFKKLPGMDQRCHAMNGEAMAGFNCAVHADHAVARPRIFLWAYTNDSYSLVDVRTAARQPHSSPIQAQQLTTTTFVHTILLGCNNTPRSAAQRPLLPPLFGVSMLDTSKGP